MVAKADPITHPHLQQERSCVYTLIATSDGKWTIIDWNGRGVIRKDSISEAVTALQEIEDEAMVERRASQKEFGGIFT